MNWFWLVNRAQLPCASGGLTRIYGWSASIITFEILPNAQKQNLNRPPTTHSPVEYIKKWDKKSFWKSNFWRLHKQASKHANMCRTSNFRQNFNFFLLFSFFLDAPLLLAIITCAEDLQLSHSSLKNISDASGLVELPTLLVVYTTEEDMLSFLELPSNIWPTIVWKRAACVQPLAFWPATHKDFADNLKSQRRQQALLHAPFTDKTAHSVLFRQRRMAGELSFLNIQSDDESVLHISLIGATRAMTVLYHNCLVK